MKNSGLDLMRHYDSESNAQERREIEASLESDQSSREYLASLEATSLAVRAWEESLSVDDISDQVMSRIEHGESRRSRKVVKLRRLAWTLMGSGLAAAACLWLWLGTTAGGHGQPSDELARLPAVTPVSRVTQHVAEVSAGVAIEKLDFGANSGSIFVVQGSGEATPVVWLSDPEGDQAKMEPL